MGQVVSVDVEVISSFVRIERIDEFGNERVITLIANVGDAYGNLVGEVGTDILEFAPNLPLALVKAYWLIHKLEKGTLVPELDL